MTQPTADATNLAQLNTKVDQLLDRFAALEVVMQSSAAQAGANAGAKAGRSSGAIAGTIGGVLAATSVALIKAKYGF